jgi:hypothetical protein
VVEDMHVPAKSELPLNFCYKFGNQTLEPMLLNHYIVNYKDKVVRLK